MNQDNKIVPYGYSLSTDGVTLIPVQKEQEVLALVRSLLSEGLSIAQIAVELNQWFLLTDYYWQIGQNEKTGLALPPEEA